MDREKIIAAVGDILEAIGENPDVYKRQRWHCL